ncbi:hypothetical protein JHK85_016424 [Glycine max]|nr:hypothetical protein JHK85_016424 [Glycine max]
MAKKALSFSLPSSDLTNNHFSSKTPHAVAKVFVFTIRWSSLAYAPILLPARLVQALNLNVHALGVLSVTLNGWSSYGINATIEVGGNSSANSIYEANFLEGYTKPRPDASHEQL